MCYIVVTVIQSSLLIYYCVMLCLVGRSAVLGLWRRRLAADDVTPCTTRTTIWLKTWTTQHRSQTSRKRRCRVSSASSLIEMLSRSRYEAERYLTSTKNQRSVTYILLFNNMWYNSLEQSSGPLARRGHYLQQFQAWSQNVFVLMFLPGCNATCVNCTI